MKHLPFILVLTFAITGCNNRRDEITSLNTERDSLMSLIIERDSSINDFIIAYTEIENNLRTVNVKQENITKNVANSSGDLKTSVKNRINNEINAINSLMEKSKKDISQLNKKIKYSNLKNKGFEKMLATLNSQIAYRDSDLIVLNSKLNTLNQQIFELQTTVSDLETTSGRQTGTINEQISSLHTAYYIVGKSKELQKSNIIKRTGGFLGIGKTSRLNDNLDHTKFTKIDYTKTLHIPVNSDAKIVTAHPAVSYELQNDKKDKDKVIELIITDPDKFWSTSKYLVVVKK